MDPSTLSRYGLWVRGGGECYFAVRSGGHTPFAGSANIENGVTIDLSAMKDIRDHPDRSVTSIGPGAKWGDVYLHLDNLGLAVPGGRVSEVGVAGLTTGGMCIRSLSIRRPHLMSSRPL